MPTKKQYFLIGSFKREGNTVGRTFNCGLFLQSNLNSRQKQRVFLGEETFQKKTFKGEKSRTCIFTKIPFFPSFWNLMSWRKKALGKTAITGSTFREILRGKMNHDSKLYRQPFVPFFVLSISPTLTNECSLSLVVHIQGSIWGKGTSANFSVRFVIYRASKKSFFSFRLDWISASISGLKTMTYLSLFAIWQQHTRA